MIVWTCHSAGTAKAVLLPWSFHDIQDMWPGWHKGHSGYSYSATRSETLVSWPHSAYSTHTYYKQEGNKANAAFIHVHTQSNKNTSSKFFIYYDFLDAFKLAYVFLGTWSFYNYYYFLNHTLLHYRIILDHKLRKSIKWIWHKSNVFYNSRGYNWVRFSEHFFFFMRPVYETGFHWRIIMPRKAKSFKNKHTTKKKK